MRERKRWRTIDTEHGPTEALLPLATFADVEARMDNVPGLGQHTHCLLAETGLDPAAIDGTIAAGVAHQTKQFQPLPR